MISLKKLIEEEVKRVLREDVGATTGPTSTTKPSVTSPSTGKNPSSGTLPSKGGEESKNSSPVDPFGDQEQPNSSQTDSSSSQEQEEVNLTPEEEVMKMATELSKQTRDVPTILKGVKATIQKRYPNPTQASGLINSLEGSQDETLKGVALQLKRFLGIR